ncbi:MAG: hypothetical protein SGCHY_004972 [Lobulomycetales sp.]
MHAPSPGGFRLAGRKFSRLQSRVLTSTLVVILLAVCGLFGWFNQKEGDLKARRGFSSPDARVDPFSNSRSILTSPSENSPRPNETSFTGIVVRGKVTNIDIPSFRYYVNYEIFLYGQGLVSPWAPRTPLQEVELAFGEQVRLFPAGKSLPSVDVTYTISEGDTNRYPFDDYSDTFEISSRITANFSALPVVVGFIGSLQNWRFDIAVENTMSESSQNVRVGYQRSVTTKFFSLLIITVLWALSLSTFILALTLVLRGRRVEPPTMGFAAALLFAIPAVRNLQPGIPEIGCTADVMGLFWNIGLTGVGALLLIVNYIVKYRGSGVNGSGSSAGSIRSNEEEVYIADLGDEASSGVATIPLPGDYNYHDPRKDAFH